MYFLWQLPDCETLLAIFTNIYVLKVLFPWCHVCHNPSCFFSYSFTLTFRAAISLSFCHWLWQLSCMGPISVNSKCASQLPRVPHGVLGILSVVRMPTWVNWHTEHKRVWEGGVVGNKAGTVYGVDMGIVYYMGWGWNGCMGSVWGLVWNGDGYGFCM